MLIQHAIVFKLTQKILINLVIKCFLNNTYNYYKDE